MAQFFACGKKPSFEGYTLVLPAVSVGNVGQLACDALICTLKLEKVGHFLSPFVLPMCANQTVARRVNPASCVLSVPIEVYASPTYKLAVVQQRSPSIKRKRAAHAASLIEFCRKQRFAEVLFLTSSQALFCQDAELAQKQRLSFAAQPAETTLAQLAAAEGWATLPHANKQNARDRQLLDTGETNAFLSQWDKACPLLVLTAACTEGDNAPDGDNLARRVHALLARPERALPLPAVKRWRQPAVWRYVWG